MQDREYSDQPGSWQMPDEPPVGTVVTDGSAKWQRDEDLWWREGGVGCGLTWGELLHKGGLVTEVLPTPAEEQAARLVNLARHLNAHPGLPPVNVTGELQVKAADALEPAPLLAWAASMAEPGMRVQFIKGVAYVHVSGRVGDRVESVFDTVPGFFEYLDGRQLVPENKRETDLPLVVLEDFAKQQALEAKLAGELAADEPAGGMDAFSAGVAAEVAAEADGPVAP